MPWRPYSYSHKCPFAILFHFANLLDTALFPRPLFSPMSSSSSRSLSPPISHHLDKINGETEEQQFGTEREFLSEFVGRHNELRNLHGCPKLTLSEELSGMAKEWADRIAWQGHVSFAEMSGIGENATVFPEEKCAREMVDYWYEENRKYEYDSPGWQEGTNYFTQIVWKSTREIGVGRSEMRSFPQQMSKNVWLWHFIGRREILTEVANLSKMYRNQPYNDS